MEELTFSQVYGTGGTSLQIDDGLNEGDVIRLDIHFQADAPPPPPPPPGGGEVRKLYIPEIVHSVIVKAAQTYIALSCDTDGAWRESYRYGYQAFEKDNEVSGNGNHLSFNDFGYDTRIGRRWTRDKHAFKYPSISPFATFNNNPIVHTDPDGKDATVAIKGNVITVSAEIVLWGADATKGAVAKFQSEVNATWNASSLTYKDVETGKEYQVKFDIHISLAGGKERVASQPLGAYNPFNTNNYVEVNNAKLDAENAANGTAAITYGGDEGLFGTSDPAYIKGIPHEIGHMLGLDHHYTSTGDAPGWENNVMGAIDGKDGKSGAGDVDQRNVDAVAAPAVRAFNKERSNVERSNKLLSTKTTSGGPSPIPTEYKTKIDNSSMDQ